MAISTERASLGAAAGVTVALAALYVTRAAVGPVVGDGPELTIAAHTLGIPHPSGYPLFTLLSRVVSLFGDPTRALHVLNALFAALGVGLIALHVSARTGTGAGVLAGLMLGGSATLVREATRYEVYSFWLLLLALLLYLPRSRPLLFVYVAGLAFAHHLAILFVMPAVVAAAWPYTVRLLRSPARAGLAAALFAIGVTVYVYLPVRSALGPVWNWGAPSDFARFVAHVTGRGYWGYAGGGGVNDLLAFCRGLPREISWAGFLLVPLGALSLVLQRKWYEGAAIALGIGGIASYIGYYGVNDPEPYFIPIVVFASFLFAWGVAFLAAGVGRLRPVLYMALGAALVWQAGSNAIRFDRSDDSLLTGYVNAILQTVQEGGGLVVEGDTETFGLFHEQIVKGRRTDITVFNSLFDLGPEGPLFAGESRRGPGWKQAALLAALRAGTPVYTAVEQDLFAEPGYVLRPHGLLYRWYREGSPGIDPDVVWDSYDLGFVSGVDRDAEFLERWIAANVWTKSARRAFRAGDDATGRAFLRRAEEVAGASAATWLNVGRVARENGDVEEALRLFREAAEHAHDGLVAWNEADLLIARGLDAERADSLLAAVASRDPRLRYAATLRRGRLAIDERRFAAARERFREAARLRPAAAAPQFGLWETGVLLGDGESVSRALDELDRLAPGSADTRDREEATFFETAGDEGAADSVYAIMLTPDNRDPYDWNAAAWNQAVRDSFPATALLHADKALALSPEDPYVLDTKGWALFRIGRYEQAADHMDRALIEKGLTGAGPRWRRAIVAHAAGDREAEMRWVSEAGLWRDDQTWR
ncbi:MAG: DUF2723 domain-containing protein, partial [Gemmatimonadetes bacterium]|nr:DUF2723 domain-containing protein [Gemmatimonadota bacterium]